MVKLIDCEVNISECPSYNSAHLVSITGTGALKVKNQVKSHLDSDPRFFITDLS